MVWDWLPILVIAGGYDLVRSRAPDLLPRAITEPQLRFDEIVFGGTTPTVRLQNALVDRGTPHWWDYPAWCMYLSHFVFTPAIALWLYLRHRAWFHRYAILILTVSLCGFVTYFIVPAVPPWLASRNGDLEPTTRIVHSVWANLGVTGAAKVFAGDAKLRQPRGRAAVAARRLALHDAAVPVAQGRSLAVGIVAYNAMMVLVLVYGAEHYVSDIILGWIYATVVFVVVTWFLDRRRSQSTAGAGRADERRWSATSATGTSRRSPTTAPRSSTRSTARCASTSTRRGSASAPTTTRGSASSPARAGRSASVPT